MRVTDVDRVTRLLVSAVGPDVDRALIPRIAETGALLEGHFRLQGGEHSPYFLRFGQLAFRRADAIRIAEILAPLVDLPREGLVVLGTDNAAQFLATALGSTLGTPVALARVDDQRRPLGQLKDGASLSGAKAILVTTDVLVRGASIKPVIDLAREQKGAEILLAAFATLHPGGTARIFRDLDIRGVCLLQARWETWQPAQCDLCREGRALVPAFEFI